MFLTRWMILWFQTIYLKCISAASKVSTIQMALVKILNDLRLNMDMKKLSILVLLDLTAAFDTVDHCILLDRLQHKVGLSGSVFNWFKSFLTYREFYVSIGEHSSTRCKMECGVSQGSILGPTLFNLYMLPLGQVIRRHGIHFHSYADNTQLYIAVSPDDLSPVDTLFNFLPAQPGQNWGFNYWSWRSGREAQSQAPNIVILPSEKVKNLGVIFHSELGFEPHIKSLTKSGFCHLKNIPKVKPFLSQASAETLIHAFITNRVGYFNPRFSSKEIGSTFTVTTKLSSPSADEDQEQRAYHT